MCMMITGRQELFFGRDSGNVSIWKRERIAGCLCIAFFIVLRGVTVKVILFSLPHTTLPVVRTFVMVVWVFTNTSKCRSLKCVCGNVRIRFFSWSRKRHWNRYSMLCASRNFFLLNAVHFYFGSHSLLSFMVTTACCWWCYDV